MPQTTAVRSGKIKLEKEIKRKQKGLGIGAKFLLIVLPVVVAVIGGVLWLVYTSTSEIILAKSEDILFSKTQSAVNQVTAWMNTTITALEQERDTIELFTPDDESTRSYLKHTADQYEAFPAGLYLGTARGDLIHASYTPEPGFNVFERSWYNEGLQSEDFIFGSVYLDVVSNSYVVGASGVLKNADGTVRGVAAADIYLDAISGIISGVQIEQTGGMFLVDGLTNTIIGHRDSAVVGTLLTEQQESMYPYVDSLIKSGTTGLQSCMSDAGEISLSLMPVPNSKWTAVAYVPNSEVMADLNTITRSIIFLAVAGIVLLVGLIAIIVRRIIVRPIDEIDGVARSIADGRLDEKITYSSNDELGDLALNFNKTVQRLNEYVNYIQEISRVLDDIAEGNLDFSLTQQYQGEFRSIKTSLEHIANSLSVTIHQIRDASHQFSSGSEQVANGAQALSQGAAEQASEVAQLSDVIGQISLSINNNATHTQQAKEQANGAGELITQSNRKMQDMIAAIEQISKKSSEIGKIIKTIDDIAFQTNILALNAAVEAARAGAAGKGFAVVADEVRNLAGKSAEAAKNTTALIEDSIVSVKNGSEIAADTAASMLMVVDKARQVTDLVDEIASASSSQAQGVVEISHSVDQISGVVQTNSATAEQSAAASEELSGQAQVLRELVGKFKLKA